MKSMKIMVKLGQMMNLDGSKTFFVNKDNQVDEKKSKKKKYGFGSEKPEKRKNKESHRDLFSRDLDEECFHESKECKRSIKKNNFEDLDDEVFLLEEYESEEEGGGRPVEEKKGFRNWANRIL